MFVRELASHVTTASRLLHDAPSGPLRGAVNLATIAAYRLVATEAESEATHADKVAALRHFVATVGSDHAPFLTALIDAALAAEVGTRAARGAPIYGRRLRGWMDPVASASPGMVPAGSAVAPPIPDDVMRACAEAEALDDVDAAFLDILRLTRAMKVAAQRGHSRRALLDAYETAALGLCVRPVASGADDARWLLLHAWSLLRRKRPIAAAVIRARFRWTRTTRKSGSASMVTD